MLLLRGATWAFHLPLILRQFQYMLLLRGATRLLKRRMNRRLCFNTCSSCEEQPVPALARLRIRRFNTCSSCEEQHGRRQNRNGGDGFNTCSSCEEQHGRRQYRNGGDGFNTCSSCEEQLFASSRSALTFSVSIHAPLARSNKKQNAENGKEKVSIHAPLARSNRCWILLYSSA